MLYLPDQRFSTDIETDSPIQEKILRRHLQMFWMHLESLIRFGIQHNIKNDTPEMFAKILGATGDNASSNDTMVDSLAKLSLHFKGASSCVRCVLHVINLVAKSMLKLFNSPQKCSWSISEEADEMFNLLNDDANKVDLSLGENSTEDEDDNVEGWIDEVELLTDEECETLDNHIEPL